MIIRSGVSSISVWLKLHIWFPTCRQKNLWSLEELPNNKSIYAQDYKRECFQFLTRSSNYGIVRTQTKIGHMLLIYGTI